MSIYDIGDKIPSGMFGSLASGVVDNHLGANWTPWGKDIKESYDSLKQTAVDINQGALEDEKRWSMDEINTPEFLLRMAGRTGEGLGSVVSNAIDLVTPDALSTLLGSTVTSGIDSLLDTDPARAGLQYLADNPRVAANVNAGMGASELLLPKVMLDPVRRAISSLKNYIPNHYAPEVQKLKDMPDNFDGFTDLLLKHKVKGVKTKKEAFHLAQKLTGAKDWVKSGIAGGIDSFMNPASRALYDKHGINRTSQKTVISEMKLYEQEKRKGNTSKAARHKEIAVAQMNYNKYITVQTGRKGKVAKAMDSVLDSVSYDGMQVNTVENYINSARKQKSTISSGGARGKKTFSPLEATNADLTYAYNTAQRIWNIKPDAGNKLVVKKNTGVGGNHNSDAIGMKNKAHKYIKDLYTELGTDDPMTIFNHYQALPLDQRPKGVIFLNKSVGDVAVNGLWLSSSQVGSAVVEGGINVITKIMPNKKAMSMVSDVHDFGEKIPVVGSVLGKALPNAELSLTPPIYSDLRPPKQKRGDARNVVSLDKGQTGRVSDATIADYTNARPSFTDIAMQGVKMPAQALIVGNGLFDYPTNPQDQYRERNR